MKIYKTLLSLTALALGLSSCSKPKNDLQTDSIKGNVTKMVIGKYQPVEKNGQIINGNMTSKQVATYNEDGNVTNLDNTYIYGAGDSAEVSHKIYTFEYNADGQKVSIKESGSKQPFEFFKYEDRLVSEITYKGDAGKVSSTVKFSYNDGLISEVNYYNETGTVERKEKHLQNSKGLVEEIDSYDANGSAASKILFTYNNDGLVDTYKQTGGSYAFELEQKYFNTDKEGNWTRNVTYKDHKPYEITERTITYK
ncbi:hypothetical protein FPZ43_08390 [Mucilaginibacter pallidiroseus]|uniref:YD repeat-containing protein n=1 Tax=Mucilaginibacter pallidiroseus TaxID=2599295 RepID=A0A563UES1_9SPHI|nr:hypothetical protein [Mucilaginibacter pallidiroseus]TWR29860.1 hypothetical protein FPZ43_08390 [Mucilaginibacter pallidiroseus]